MKNNKNYTRQAMLHSGSYINWKQESLSFTKELKLYLAKCARAKKEANLISCYVEAIHNVFALPLFDKIERAIEVTTRTGPKPKTSIKSADLFYFDVLIEFETSLSRSKKDHAEQQLKEYLSGLHNESNSARRFKAFISDGSTFIKYTYAYPDSAQKITPDDINLSVSFELDLQNQTKNGDNLTDKAPHKLFRDELLPTEPFEIEPQNIHELFKPGSSLYVECLQLIKKSPKHYYKTSYDEWEKYLNVVYGNLNTIYTQVYEDKAQPTPAHKKLHINNKHKLFFEHTYLATIAKVLAYCIIMKQTALTNKTKLDILHGSAFNDIAIRNFLPEDFFSWIATVPAKHNALGIEIIDNILMTMTKFDANKIDRDILRAIYESVEATATRHEIGAVYTPDWLAEKIIAETMKNRRDIPRLLDPTCGSGTFLSISIKMFVQLLQKSNMPPSQILDKISSCVVGIDIHPVALLFSKTNYLIAVKGLLAHKRSSFNIPVYLADSINFPIPISANSQINAYNYKDNPDDASERFNMYIYETDSKQLALPQTIVESKNVDLIIDELQQCAQDISTLDSDSSAVRLKGLLSHLRNAYKIKNYHNMLVDTTKGLACLIKENKDGIHAFIFKNICKPAVLGTFDIIVGNPPWVVYSTITDPQRKRQIKSLIESYELQGPGKFNTSMEMATLFFVKCVDSFLKTGGVIGFVMPRSILQASQHDKFRSRPKMHIKYTKLYDMGEPNMVRPLFTVESCVLFAQKSARVSKPSAIPAEIFAGNIGTKNATWGDILKLMKQHLFKITRSTIHLHKTTTGGTVFNYQHGYDYSESPYMTKFKQGSTLVPQPMWFVEHSDDEFGSLFFHSRVKTSTELAPKQRWKKTSLSGMVESEFLFNTIRGSSIIPFGVKSSDTIVLPIMPNADKYSWYDSQQLTTAGKPEMSRWMKKCEKLWSSRRTDKSPKTLKDRVDYNHAITDQNPRKKIVVLYNRSGREHLVSCIVPPDMIEQHGGFISDSGSYYYYPKTMDEAKYLCAVLNSPFLFTQVRAIKAARDIHRSVWNLPIPSYDPKNPRHQELVRSYARRHSIISSNARSISTRKSATALIKDDLDKIDEILKLVLAEATPGE